jgi:TRAP-type mannitol/chloroaromatic compound transport system permease small subunit
LADVLTFPLFIVFFGILLYKASIYGFESLAMREYSTTTWGPPLYPWKLTVPVIVLLMIGQGLANFVRNICLVLTGEEP